MRNVYAVAILILSLVKRMTTRKEWFC